MEQAQGNGPELLNQSTQSSEDHPPSKERIMKKAQEHFITTLGKNRVIQLVRRYQEEVGREGRHYHESHIVPDLPDWHPKFTLLILVWTFSGEWVSVPKHEALMDRTLGTIE